VVRRFGVLQLCYLYCLDWMLHVWNDLDKQ
jgi:hypothetical protein